MSTATLTKEFKNVDVQEFVNIPAGRVDKEKGIIYDVKIIGNQSSNGRYYPQSVLESAIHLYENASVFADHPDSSDPSTVDLDNHVGHVMNVRSTKNGLRGDLVLKMSNPIAQYVMESVISGSQDKIGLSHNAVVSTQYGQPNGRVEKIVSIRSVDLVSNPATNVSLFEEDNTMTIEEKQELETLRAEKAERVALEARRVEIQTAAKEAGYDDPEILCALEGGDVKSLLQLIAKKARPRSEAIETVQVQESQGEGTHEDFLNTVKR